MIPLNELHELGVKRISYGPHSYFQTQQIIQENAQTILLPSNIILKRVTKL